VHRVDLARHGGIIGGGGGCSPSRSWSSDLGSWMVNPSLPVKSGLIDAHRWFGVGMQGSGEGVLAGLPDSLPVGRGGSNGDYPTQPAEANNDDDGAKASSCSLQ
jgi:hypothetical protein